MVARLFNENRNPIQPPRRLHSGKVRGVRSGEDIGSARTRASKRRAPLGLSL
jgi:hypothetical protein